MKYKFTILISIVVVILSTIPVPEIPSLEGVPLWDKWAHMVMYAGVAMAMWFDQWFITHKTKRQPTVLFAVMSETYPALLGGAMELVQAYCTTCRSGDYMDFLADCMGSYLGVLLSLAIWKIVKISVRK